MTIPSHPDMLKTIAQNASQRTAKPRGRVSLIREVVARRRLVNLAEEYEKRGSEYPLEQARRKMRAHRELMKSL